MGWSDVQNGQLLSFAEEAGFEVLLTADANIKSQQSVVGRAISIVILRALNNRLATHFEMLADVRLELSKIEKGEVAEVFHRN